MGGKNNKLWVSGLLVFVVSWFPKISHQKWQVKLLQLILNLWRVAGR